MKTLIQQTYRNVTQAFEVPTEPSVLDQSPEIFSCGGVFLGNRQIMPAKREGIRSLFLPNYQQEILFVRGAEITHRSKAYEEESEEVFAQAESAQSKLRRHFRENLN